MTAQVLGVDFSGANQAGNHIWLAEGELEDGVLAISKLWSPAGTGKTARTAALEYVVDRVTESEYDVVGFAVPFGPATGHATAG